jgi:hypothetical protein
MCGNLTFIRYLCEICSISESGNCSVSNEEKGRRAKEVRISYLSKGRNVS